MQVKKDSVLLHSALAKVKEKVYENFKLFFFLYQLPGTNVAILFNFPQPLQVRRGHPFFPTENIPRFKRGKKFKPKSCVKENNFKRRENQ